MRRIVAIAFAAALALGGTLVAAGGADAAGTTRYVSHAGTDTGACTNPAKPCATIQYGVDVAHDGDSVEVTGGDPAYVENVVVTDKSLNLVALPGPGSDEDKNRVTVEAASANEPTFTFVGTVGHSAPNDVLSSGDQLAAFAIMKSSTSSAGVTVDGADFTLSDAVVEGPAAATPGAGIEVESGAAALNNVSIGGAQTGVRVEQDATLTSQSSTLEANSTYAIDDAGGTVSLTGDFIDLIGSQHLRTGVGIRVRAGSSGVRGAVSLSGVVIQSANLAGIDAAASDVTITRSSLVYSGLYAAKPYTAALLLGAGAKVNLIQSGIAGGGQGIRLAGSGASLTVERSTIDDNHGEGVEAGPGTIAVIDNSTLWHNGHYQIGSIGAKVSVRNSTIYDSGAIGLGTLAATGHTTSLAVQGTVISGGNNAHDCTGAIHVTDGGYNSSADAANPCRFGAPKHDLVHTDPLLNILGAYGGPTRTRLPKATSPLLNRIPVGSAGCTTTGTDQRGAPRLVGSRCDIGSVEGTTPTAG